MWFKVNFLSIILKFLYGSNRKDVRGRHHYESLIASGTPVILSIWHGRLLNIVHDLRKSKIHAIAGTHKDAELISQIATKWGWMMMRGSSKEKGEVAYKDMLRALRQPGNMVFITPDGPTGPAKVPKPGVIRAAQATGAAIIPIHATSTRHWGFTNWDTFFVDKPFGKIFIEYGEPFFLQKDQSHETCESILIENMSTVETSNLHYTNNESS